MHSLIPPTLQPFNSLNITTLTIRVQLVRVGCQPAVVLVVRYTIIIIIIVTSVSFAILVMVSLVGVGHIWTVVQVVLMAVFINVLVIVTLISNQVIVNISLLDKYGQRFNTYYSYCRGSCHFLCSVVQYLVRVV